MTAISSGASTAASNLNGATGATFTAASGPISTQVELTDSTAYREVLQIRAINAVPGTHDLSVRSQLDTARDPEAWHVRYRVALDTASLGRLYQALGEYLQKVGELQTGGGRA